MLTMPPAYTDPIAHLESYAQRLLCPITVQRAISGDDGDYVVELNDREVLVLGRTVAQAEESIRRLACGVPLVRGIRGAYYV
jgi:hypothetical protein